MGECISLQFTLCPSHRLIVGLHKPATPKIGKNTYDISHTLLRFSLVFRLSFTFMNCRWYVKKHLTEETGWVPAQYLKDEETYTMYVQRKLVEKIEKLPVFESKDLNYLHS
jgi:hypothetical protein